VFVGRYLVFWASFYILIKFLHFKGPCMCVKPSLDDSRTMSRRLSHQSHSVSRNTHFLRSSFWGATVFPDFP
jgi:hypothetical protein